MDKSDFDRLQGWANELDPERADEAHKAEMARKRYEAALRTQISADAKSLASDARFKRWLYTVLERSGNFAAVCHAHSGQQYFADGRRALGLEILDDVAQHAPDILVSVQLERLKFMEKHSAEKQ